MRITEMFYSIQGEGRHSGIPTTFVRTTGCHLRCSWCDAEYTFKGGETKSLDEVMEFVAAQPTKKVCFTGGEPLLQKDAWQLIDRLVEGGYHTLIETAGNLDFSHANSYDAREQICISMDIKCPSSKMDGENTPEKILDLRAPDQLKFVINDRTDYEYAKETLAAYEGRVPCPIYFNPVGGVEPKQLTEWVMEDGLPVHVGIQIHKLIWGNIPGV
jgi:7-carboxy-7-deazaguanine synthase